MIGRGWLIAGAIMAVGLAGEREDGLAAAILCIALFSIYFPMQMIVRPVRRARRPGDEQKGEGLPASPAGSS